MRKILGGILIAGCLALLPASADAQRQCKDGTRTTLSGTIQKIDAMEPEPGQRIWIVTPQGTPSGACTVKQIWAKGRAPANCGQGKSFTATGKVMDAESFMLLYADTATCK